MRHWLATLNVALGLFVLGAVAAPILAALGMRTAASCIYMLYHYTCHQWAFRSFFLFGAVGGAPVAAYDQAQLANVTSDAFGFLGNADLGWKMGFCERDLAIYAALLAVGLLYARRRDRMAPLGFGAYAVLIMPMAIDGFTQLFGWRESTWQLRVMTGLLFGVASAWLVLPRLDASFGLTPSSWQYAPSASRPCDPVRPIAEPEPWIELSPRG